MERPGNVGQESRVLLVFNIVLMQITDLLHLDTTAHRVRRPQLHFVTFSLTQQPIDVNIELVNCMAAAQCGAACGENDQL